MAFILIVEDDPEISALMALTLRTESHTVMQARDGAQALQMIEDRAPDLILLDVMMPRMSGHEVARQLQNNPATAHIPIIFVTANSTMEDRVMGLDMAVDYICKPFAAPELMARVRAALRMRKLQDQLRDSNEELAKLATTDPLTNLCNRRAFDSELESELQRARRFGHPLTVVMCDLDRFKSVNDTWGHAQGDVVLQAFARELEQSSRRIDTVARLGGEEFGLILPAAGGDGALTFAEKLRHSVEEMEIPCRNLEGEEVAPLGITVSIGVAVAARVEGSEEHISELASELVQTADRLLYQAKETGRNRVASQILETLSVAG